MLRHLDLFSGIGGFALAAQIVGGIETRQFVEIDPFCQKVLARNFPGVPIHDDVATFTAKPGRFDLITGGFPCQPHSHAGKRQASADDRDLWPELYRIICEVQPRWIVLENVVGLLSSEAGRFFRGVLWDLAKAGFDAEWSVVSAASVGACHLRERIWIVAYPNGAGLEKWECGPSWKTSILPDERCWSGYDRRPKTRPTLYRGSDGVPHRVDRIKSLGNAVVPAAAAVPLRRVLALASELKKRPPVMSRGREPEKGKAP